MIKADSMQVALAPGQLQQLQAFLPPLARLGSLEVRLAVNTAEIEAAQELRHKVFYQELGAISAGGQMIDSDRFDAYCDHLVVLDSDLPGPDHRRVVGTYRLLRQEIAAQHGGFYSADEYEIDRLAARNRGKRFLELGRSCVLPAYRSKRTIEALWEAIWAYVQAHDIDVMAGCASFPGVDPLAHAQALSFLAQNCLANDNWAVRAQPHRYHPMNILPADRIDAKTAIRQMPPLIKGDLKLGASFGDGCVIDVQFDTIDVFVVMPISAIQQRYINYYTAAPQA